MKSHTMKFSAPAFAGLLAAAFFVSSRARAETAVDTSVMGVSGSVGAINNLVAQSLNVSDNLPPAPPLTLTSIAFAAITARPLVWRTEPQQYVKINVDDNAVSWRLRVYTRNFAASVVPDTDDWGFTYGGLIGGPPVLGVPGKKVPMAWTNNPTVIAGGIPIGGNPSLPANARWLYFKDFKDVDDPTTGTIVAPQREDFASADADGYTNIAFGSAAFTRIIAPLTLPDRSIALATVTTPWYLYFGADFGSAPADPSYTGVMILELLNQ